MFSKYSKTGKIVFFLIFVAIFIASLFLFTDLNTSNIGIKEGNDDSTLFTKTQNGVTFKYSKELSTEYISPQSWPPKARVLEKEDKLPPKFQILDEGIVCTETDEKDNRSKVFNKIIDDRMYCIETLSEGAAGSVYTEYAYSSIIKDKVITLSFALRFPNCQNYSSPERDKCQKEREIFNPDTLIKQIVNTLNFNK